MVAKATMRRSIRVRIAVAVDSGGEWNANGWGGRDRSAEMEAMSMALDCVGPGAARYWVEVEVPVPDDPASDGDAEVIEGVISPTDD